MAAAEKDKSCSSSELVDVLEPFYQRASEAEDRISRLEAVLASKRGAGNEELLKTICELQLKVEAANAEVASERKKNEGILKAISEPKLKLEAANGEASPGREKQSYHLQPSINPSNHQNEGGSRTSVFESEFPTQLGHVQQAEPSNSKEVPEHAYLSIKGLWTPTEEVCLAQAWVSVSTDPIVGNNQSDKSFWDKVTTIFNYNKIDRQQRTRSAVKHKWHDMSPKVNEFEGIFNCLVSQQWSGACDDDLKLWAQDLYYKSRRKHFTLVHVWQVLKDKEKWGKVHLFSRYSKRTKNAESGTYTRFGDPPSTEEVQMPCERPMGRKAGKIKIKEKRKEKGDSSAIDAKLVTVVIDPEFNAEIRRKNDLQERMLKLAEYEVLTRDTLNMNPETLAFHLEYCKSIRRNLG